MLESNCKFTACLLESVDISNLAKDCLFDAACIPCSSWKNCRVKRLKRATEGKEAGER